MSLLPFILDLAEEIKDFNRYLIGMDVDDYDLGIYAHDAVTSQNHQQLPPDSRRLTKAVSPYHLLSNLSGGLKPRHHPYGGFLTKCVNLTTKSPGKESGAVAAAAKSAYSVVNKNGFQVSMNVKQFQKDELAVKTIDNCIVVEGRHEDKEDGHGVISRHFIRKYLLPKGYDQNDVVSTLSSDGILTVKATPPKAEEPLERIVKIQEINNAVSTTTSTNAQVAKSVSSTIAKESSNTSTAENILISNGHYEQAIDDSKQHHIEQKENVDMTKTESNHAEIESESASADDLPKTEEKTINEENKLLNDVTDTSTAREPEFVYANIKEENSQMVDNIQKDFVQNIEEPTNAVDMNDEGINTNAVAATFPKALLTIQNGNNSHTSVVDIPVKFSDIEMDSTAPANIPNDDDGENIKVSPVSNDTNTHVENGSNDDNVLKVRDTAATDIMLAKTQYESATAAIEATEVEIDN